MAAFEADWPKVEAAAGLAFVEKVQTFRPALKLAAWLAFLALYFSVLALQLKPQLGYVSGKAVEDDVLRRWPENFAGTDDVLTWVKGALVDPFWRDPVCGDGVCEAPYEYPSYGRFGCRADCGVAKDTAAAVVRVTNDFRHPSLAEQELQAVARWNICRRDDERFGVGLNDLCYFDEPGEAFPQHRQGESVAVDLAEGEWYLRVHGDPAGRTSGLMLDAAVVNADGVPAAKDAAVTGALGSRVVSDEVIDEPTAEENEFVIRPPPPPPEAPDEVHPILELNGDAEVFVDQLATYLDLGAICNDDKDGLLFVQPPEGLARVDTANPTNGIPFELKYVCTDQTGNEADPVVRLVHVRDACEEDSKVTGQTETLCLKYDPPVCSAYGSCDAVIAPQEEEVVVEAYEPDVDVDPPKISLVALNTESILQRTSSGKLVMRESIVQGDPYEEPGYVCLDGDVDITSRLSVFGGDKVSTASPTGDGSYITVTYSCSDESGNAAEPLERWVAVAPKCPEEGAVLCPDGTCGADGFCVGSGLAVSSVVEDEEPPAPDTPPTLALVGPAKLEVTAGSAYVRCPSGAPATAVCDRGARATDDKDGDLTPFVRACGKTFATHGLDGCEIDGPGVYPITFSVSDSDENNVELIRTLTVAISCPAGEEPCADRVSCTVNGGGCLDVDSDVGDEDPVPVNQEPAVTVLGSTSLQLKRFAVYAPCAEGTVSTEDAPCEMGASALDDNDGDLTEQVLACPPEACMANKCPGHEFHKKGLQGCLNMGAPVGTVFDVPFVAVDSSGLKGTASRSITIVEPCAPGEYWCPEDSPDGRCETLTCEKVEELKNSLPSTAEGVDDGFGPIITLHAPAEMPFVLLYGTVNDNVLRPCVSSLGNATYPDCIASAVDAVDGDMSSRMQVVAGSAACTGAALAQGLCPPGSYEYTLVASDLDGRSGELQVRFRVVDGTFASYQIRRNETSGGCTAVLDPTSEEGAAVRGIVANALVLSRGHTRIRECAAEDAGEVVVTVDVVLERLSRRMLQEDEAASGLTSVGRSVASPPSTGAAADARRAQSLLLASDAMYNRLVETQNDVQIAQLLADGLAGSQSTVVGDAFDATKEAAREGQQANLAKSEELLELTTALLASLENVTDALSASAASASLDDSLLQLERISTRAQRIIGEAESFAQADGAQSCKRSNEGAVYTYYDVRSAEAVATPPVSPSDSPRQVFSATSSAKRRAMPKPEPPEPLPSPPSSRKLLRVSSSSRNSGEDLIKPTVEGFDAAEVWGGYNGQLSASEDSLNEIMYGRYDKPRGLGPTGALRVIGGIVLQQVRGEYNVGCASRASHSPARGSSRFRHLRPPDAYCSLASTSNAFGVDPIFARVRGGGDDEPVLYNPSLHHFKDAFYNRTERDATGTPFAFLREKGDDAWQLYVDGNLGEASANRLLWYLRLGRYIDGRTQSATVRLPLHHPESSVLVDMKLRIDVASDGTLHTDTEISVVPLQYYLDGPGHMALLLAFEIFLFIVSLVLCINTAARLAHFLRGLLTMMKLKREASSAWVPTMNIKFDAWDIAREGMNTGAPLLLFIGYVLRFTLMFGYVRNFRYESAYDWYDMPSAEARILLPKRAGDRPGPTPGYPYGAFRHNLPRDTSGQDAYLALLEDVDAMVMLHYSYAMIQYPLILLILLNMCRLLGTFSGFYPIMRSMQRSVGAMTILIGLILGLCIVSADAMHMIAGDRLEIHKTLLSSLEFFGEFLLGEWSGLLNRYILGKDTGDVLLPAESIAICLIYFFASFGLLFLLLQFIIAVFTDLFAEERERRRGKEAYITLTETPDAKFAHHLLEGGGPFAKLRTAASAVLYAIGWRNISAYVLSLDPRYLDSSPDAPIGFSRRPRVDDHSAEMLRKWKGLLLGTSAMVADVKKYAKRWRESIVGSNRTSSEEDSAEKMDKKFASRWQRRAAGRHPLKGEEDSAEESARQNEAEESEEGREVENDDTVGKDVAAHAIDKDIAAHEHNAEDVFEKGKDGLKSDADRWLRMHRRGRWEIQAPVVGTVAERMLTQLMLILHKRFHAAQEPGDGAGDAKMTSTAMVRKMSLADRMTSVQNLAKTSSSMADVLKRSLHTSARLDLSPADMMLFEFLDKNWSAELERSVRLTDARKRDFLSRACANAAYRVVRGVGGPVGAELDREVGLELVRVVLMRARDVARGLSAVSEDVLTLDRKLEGAARELRRTVPASSVPNSGKPRRRRELASLTRFAMRAASDVAWKVTGTALRSAVKVTQPCVPWHDARAEKLLRELAVQREVRSGRSPEHESFSLSRRPSLERAAKALVELFADDVPLEKEFRDFGCWPAVREAESDDDGGDERDSAAASPRSAQTKSFSFNSIVKVL